MTDSGDFPTCSICLEDYDLQNRIPKSLDCRHAFCALCLASQLESQKCPICQRPFENAENDLTMIDYLERRQQQKRVKQQNIMRMELQKLINMVEKVKARYEAKIKQFKSSNLKVAKDKNQAFSTHIKHLLKESLDNWNSEAALTRIASQLEEELECRLQEAQLFLHTLEALLENDYIGKEAFNHCQMEATRAIQTEHTLNNPYTDAMWDAYRKMFVEQLNDTSKDSDAALILGNSRLLDILFPWSIEHYTCLAVIEALIYIML